jgi:hypothetical protein
MALLKNSNSQCSRWKFKKFEFRSWNPSLQMIDCWCWFIMKLGCGIWNFLYSYFKASSTFSLIDASRRKTTLKSHKSRFFKKPFENFWNFFQRRKISRAESGPIADAVPILRFREHPIRPNAIQVNLLLLSVYKKIKSLRFKFREKNNLDLRTILKTISLLSNETIIVLTILFRSR